MTTLGRVNVRVAGGLLVLVLSIAAMGPWWDSYVAADLDGWFLHFALEMQRGRVPTCCTTAGVFPKACDATSR